MYIAASGKVLSLKDYLLYIQNTEQAQLETRGALALADQGALNQNYIAVQMCAVFVGIVFLAGARRPMPKYFRAQEKSAG